MTCSPTSFSFHPHSYSHDDQQFSYTHCDRTFTNLDPLRGKMMNTGMEHLVLMKILLASFGMKMGSDQKVE